MLVCVLEFPKIVKHCCKHGGEERALNGKALRKLIFDVDSNPSRPW
jgi:hypothetical protein